MKKLIGLITATTAIINISNHEALAADASVNATTVAITVNVSGSLSDADRRTARFMVTAENVARIGSGTNALPASTAGELKAAYEATLTRIINDAHKSYIGMVAKESAKTVLTSDQIDQLNTSIADLIASGVTPEAIIAAVKAAK